MRKEQEISNVQHQKGKCLELLGFGCGLPDMRNVFHDNIWKLPKNKICYREFYVKYHNTWNVRMFAGQWHSLHVHLSPSCVAHHVVRQALVT